MTIFRRFLVMTVLFFWQGGFVFFSGVVVPIGREEIGKDQSLITSRVSYYINLAGAVAVAPLLWDVFAPDPSLRRRRLRAMLWLILMLTLLAQVYLYYQLLAMLPDIMNNNYPPSFSLEHRAYLWISTAQLAAAIGYMVTMLLAWRAQDHVEGHAAAVAD